MPELDELVQVGLFNILEERDVQIRGYPIQFDIDVLILFSANPSTYNRSGKVIPQLKDRIGSLVQTHYPLDRATGIEILEQESEIDLGGPFPVQLDFESIDDFEPGAIARKISAIAALLDVRNKLKELLTKTDRSPDLETLLEQIVQNENMRKELMADIESDASKTKTDGPKTAAPEETKP